MWDFLFDWLLHLLPNWLLWTLAILLLVVLAVLLYWAWQAGTFS